MMHQWITRAVSSARAGGTAGRPGPAPPRRGGWRRPGFPRWRQAAVLAAVLALPAVAAVGQASPAWASSCQLPTCVAVGGYPYGVAADPGTGTVFVANIDGTVSVISEASGTVAATIPVGLYPEAVAADQATGTVYVANYGSSNVSVISEAASPANDAVAATLATSSHPLAVVAGPAAGTVWVEEAGGGLQEITEAASPASDTLGSPVSLPGGYPYLNDPQTVAADPHTGTVWATDGDGVSVINAATSSVTTTIPLSGSPEAVAVDPRGTGTVFVAGNSSGTVSVISEATDTVTATIQIPPQGGSPADPMAMAVDEAASTVYVSSFAGSLTVISETTDSITATIDVGGAAWGSAGLAGMAFDPTTGNVYLAAESYNELYAVLSQSISFTAPATGVVGKTATLTATATSGLPVTYTVDSSSGAGVCTVSGNTVSYAHAGSCVIDANQAGNAGYFPATQVQQTITVNQAPAFILDSPPTTTGGLAGQNDYGYTFAAAGSPAVTYALAGAPSWLQINSATGAVTGTVPAGTSSFTYSVTASNTAGTATAGPFTVKAAIGLLPGLTADVAISMKCPASLTAGATGTCTLTVSNLGPATASQVEAAVLLPDQLSEVSCSSGCTQAANGLAVTWPGGSLTQGLGKATLSITVQAGPPGTAQVQAAADAQTLDTSQGNNSTSQTIPINP